MVKVLLLATRPQALETVKKLMPAGVQVRTAMMASGSTIMFETAFEADVIVVHIENVNRQRLFGVMDLREDEAYKYLPMLVIGDEEDRATFDQNVRPGADRVVDLNADESTIKQAILGVIGLREIQEKHVLIIDDDPVVLKTMRSYLEDQYVVTAVKSGKLALKFLEKQRPDAIILDYMMPEWDGSMTFQLIRSTDNGKKVPIIFATGIADKAKVMECLSLKPQGYLVKPVSKSDVLEKLRAII